MLKFYIRGCYKTGALIFGVLMETNVVLEEYKRMSSSILWKLQTAAYCQFGPQAWSHKGVPFYVTSNPFTVRQYAQIVLGYFRDCIAPGSETPLDLSQPVYIVDLGAGTGRFGYLFIKTMTEFLSPLTLCDIKICYIMTDISEKNLTFLQEHPYLQLYIKEGLLDFAFYRHDQKEPLQLLKSKKVLSQEHLVNPLVLIGNYFFDTIPQDLFRVRNKQLEEGRISISVPDKKELGELNSNNPNLIPHLICSFDYAPINDPGNYYSDFPALNNLLKLYTQQFENISFLFPSGAFQSIRYFSELSKGRMMLIAGDQGVETEDQIAKCGEPKLSLHGTFSISVNYHSIAKYFISQNGIGLLTTLPDPQFVVIVAVLGGKDGSKFKETILSFQSHINYFGPVNYLNVINYTEREWGNPSLEYLLLLLKLGNWDPMAFNDFFDKIRNHLPKASEETKKQLKEILNNIWMNFYPTTPEEGNFVTNLGVLLYDIGDYNEAMLYFMRAMDLTGSNNPQLMQNMAACYKKLNIT